MSRTKAPVTMRAAVQRINRALVKEKEQLRAARGEARAELGDYYVINTRLNGVVSRNVDVERLARELGVLKPYERMARL